jgi:hypothetical protein
MDVIFGLFRFGFVRASHLCYDSSDQNVSKG